jgi:hypothetical protein
MHTLNVGMATKSQSNARFPLLKLLCVVLSITVVVLSVKLYMSAKAQEEAQKKALAAEELKLPANAVKITECLPHMGEHWVEPSNVPTGPYYVTYKGKVLALEYMIAPTQIPGEVYAKGSFENFEKYLTSNNMTLGEYIKQYTLSLPLIPKNYKTFHIDWTAPHAGFITPHYDIHFYLVTDEELENVCPDARVQDAYSPEVLQIINKNNIPFPGQ